MATALRTQNSSAHSIETGVRWARRIAWFTLVALASVMLGQPSFAQVTVEFHRTLTVISERPVKLHVELPNGNLQILYGREGQVSISGVAKGSIAANLDDSFFARVLTVDQEGNDLALRHVSNPKSPEAEISVLYRIDVPYRTEVSSRLDRGNQNISGILGPVTAVARYGDIKASYLSSALQAQVENGNMDIHVIGEHVEARTGNGNISCTRVPQGVSAETGDGDITLMVVGPSTATVKNGRGRIDVGGARGSLTGSTVEGDLHVKAIPHDDWQLSSASGSVRLEFPPAAKMELDASTTAGEFQIDRDDMAKPAPDLHRFEQKLNGGGKRIEVHTGSGKIVIR
jgi:hypothetical protein